METCGLVPYERFERVRSHVDLFLFDWKESDPERHLASTGASNRVIRENLQRLHDAGSQILLRCPIIPGVNDREDHFKGIAELARALPNLQGVELMPYHRLGDSKIQRFGLSATDRVAAERPADDAVNDWVERVRKLGVSVVNEV
jgi:pyruvate formate lyase activating enzyme